MSPQPGMQSTQTRLDIKQWDSIPELLDPEVIR